MFIKCILDSGAINSLVHPQVLQVTGKKLSEGAVLTVTMDTSSKVLCNDVHTLYLAFMVEGGDHQVTV